MSIDVAEVNDFQSDIHRACQRADELWRSEAKPVYYKWAVELRYILAEAKELLKKRG